MKVKSYFNLFEWTIILAMALASALLNTYFPSKEITLNLGVPGPAAGMVLFGGFIFVLWVSLARLISRKRYSAIVTSIIIASICLLIRPWYGILSPPWFSIYGVISLVSLGVIIELTAQAHYSLKIVGGGLANVSCLTVTWVALGFHTHIWVDPKWSVPLLIAGAFLSGCVGAWLALSIANMVKKYRPKL